MDSNEHIDADNRHQRRISREKLMARLNSYCSPPSSTGSHPTVSTTTADLTQDLSNFSFNPDAEGTRNLSGDIAAERRPKYLRTRRWGEPLVPVNTSALRRSFPEWTSGGSSTATKDIVNNKPVRSADRPALKSAVAPVRFVNDETKENIPPLSEDAIPVETVLDNRKRTRAEMQPRVQTLSDTSTILSRTPTRPVQPSRRSRFAKAAPLQSPVSPVQDARLSLQDLVSKGRQPVALKDKEPEEPTFPMDTQQHKLMSSSPINKSGLTGRSFILPPFHHLLDWTSGTLKFSTLRNGVPVFVKHGKARTQFEQPANQHDTVEAVDVPEDDQEIFVSMDKIREEVRELQEHDEMVQREAENLQLEVNRLQTELKRFKHRKRSDSAFGSGSDSELSINKALDAQRNLYDEKIAHLQSRLEQASRQVGVHDIHSAALTAERDEALHQASVAREKAKRLQAELESTQRDLDDSMRYRDEKETVDARNKSLRATNETLKSQYEAASTSNTLLSNENAQLRRELASIREELKNLNVTYESLLEEKKMLAQDHASMERSNEAYFKENKSLRSKIEAGERRISDLEQSISRRDQLINEMQANMTQGTEPAGIREQYAELADQVKKLKQQHLADKKDTDAVVQAKDERIKSLMYEISELHARLSVTFEELHELKLHEAMWQRDRSKNDRLRRNEDILIGDLQQRARYETQWAREKASLTRDKLFLQQRVEEERKVEKRAMALLEMRRLGESELLQEKMALEREIEALRAQTGERGRVAVPSQSKAKSAASECSARSEALHVDDDPTRQVDMTAQSGFLSVLTGKPGSELKEASGQRRLVGQIAEDASLQTIDSDLPSLPGPVIRRSKSDDTMTLKRKQPAGILKKTSQFDKEDNTTGGYSVRSGYSAGSRTSYRVDGTIQSHLSAKSYRSAQVEENMTSAFIIPDITIQDKKGSTSAEENVGPALSKPAQSVLDDVCQHRAVNCVVCSRVSVHAQKIAVSAEMNNSSAKKRVRVQRPVPVSERMPETTGDNDEDHTMRPSMPPGDALAIVLKELQDEALHLELQMKAKQDELFGLDKSQGLRTRIRVRKELQKLSQEYDSKSKQVYKLHDVLEGQKQAGQLMTQEEVEVTIASICGLETTQTQESKAGFEATQGSRGSEWDGFD